MGDEGQPEEEPHPVDVAAAMLADEYDPGAGFRLRGAGLRRREDEMNYWAVFDEDDEIVDVIDADRFRSAAALLTHIGSVLELDWSADDTGGVDDVETRWAQ